MELTREDIIGIGMAYLGCFIMTWIMIWNYNIYGEVLNIDFSGFASHMGGLI